MMKHISVTSREGPFTDSYQPEENLSAFDGEQANGIWMLEIIDQVFGETGTLNSWSLNFGIEVIPGDYDLDVTVNLNDYSLLASAWQSMEVDSNWNNLCDISERKDGIINSEDLLVFSDNWMESVHP